MPGFLFVIVVILILSDVEEEYKPQKLDQQSLMICGSVIPLKIIGCKLTSDEILDKWNVLEAAGFPLKDVSSLLVAFEYKDLKNGIVNSLPWPWHLIKMIDLVDCVTRIAAAEMRINKLKTELTSLVQVAKQRPEEIRGRALQILKTLISSNDEFFIGCVLHEAYPSLEFNARGGPDFSLADIGIKMEAKSKLNRSYIGNMMNPSIPLDKSTCLKLVSKDVFEAGRLDEAFERQETDIAIMNMTHSQFGDLFAAHAYGEDNHGYELTDAVDDALKATKQQKMVILYSEQFSMVKPHAICAMSSNREAIKNYGSRLDKIQKDNKIDTQKIDGYFRLIEEARKLV
jgi:hypothetical protein